MKRNLTGTFVILLLTVLIFISCSKDSPTENGLSPTSTALVGTWELTSVRVNGVISTPETDPIFKFYEDEAIIIFRADGTGLYANDQSTVELTSWYAEEDQLFATTVEDGLEITRYSLQGITFTIFAPREDSDPSNIPDLEYIYTKK